MVKYASFLKKGFSASRLLMQIIDLVHFFTGPGLRPGLFLVVKLQNLKGSGPVPDRINKLGPVSKADSFLLLKVNTVLGP